VRAEADVACLTSGSLLQTVTQIRFLSAPLGAQQMMLDCAPRAQSERRPGKAAIDVFRSGGLLALRPASERSRALRAANGGAQTPVRCGAVAACSRNLHSGYTGEPQKRLGLFLGAGRCVASA
jgi:hypothetical protein